MGYFDGSGNYAVVSDPNKKHSLIKKSGRDDKNYLERIINLPIYSYCYKDEDYINGKKDANPHFHNTVQIGVMYDDLESTFNGGVINKPKFHKDYKCPPDCSECKELENGISQKGKGIQSHQLIYYNILAFQEYVKKTDEKINQLESKINTLFEIITRNNLN